jgi:hypothetical protein
MPLGKMERTLFVIEIIGFEAVLVETVIALRGDYYIVDWE